MAYQIRWSPRAVSNLEDTCEYIAKDSAYYAALFAKKIISLVRTIPQFPTAGRIVPEYSDKNLRERIYKNYRIVYRLSGEVVEVVAIIHGAKSLDADL
jgi:toxin ParE1/3/4